MISQPFSGFSLLTKPTGAVCNLDCTYCYYLEKEKLYPGSGDYRMNQETLEVFTRKYIHEQPGREVTFAWQGGEPTLLGIEFFRRALELQKKYGNGKTIFNSFQTNGILLNDEWCRFFKENHFLIGISIDGPEKFHDYYRVNKGGQGTFQKVVKGIELLVKHEVEFNTLTVINDQNVEEPVEIYRFLKNIGSTFIQFIPIVERLAEGCGQNDLSLVLPQYGGNAEVTAWSVPSLKFGKFLMKIFDEWVKRDVGRVFVQSFDATLANEVGVPAGVCIFNEKCGNALAIEHNGDIYSCDHFVYEDYKIGNVTKGSLKQVLLSARQQKFGSDKYDVLPLQCKECDVQNYCRGECPKNRFLKTSTGEPGLNYLCAGYKLFFRHVKPYMKYMAKQLSEGRPPANVMYARRL